MSDNMYDKYDNIKKNKHKIVKANVRSLIKCMKKNKHFKGHVYVTGRTRILILTVSLFIISHTDKVIVVLTALK